MQKRRRRPDGNIEELVLTRIIHECRREAFEAEAAGASRT